MDIASLAGIPNLSPAIKAVYQIYDAVKNVKVYHDQCLQLRDQCTVLLITLHDHGERLIGTEFMKAIDETTFTMERISRKLQAWSSWSKPKALLFQSEIKQGIDDMRRGLDECATRFHIMSQMEILSNQRETHLNLEANRAEIQKQMHSVLASIQDIHAILKQPDLKIKNHMLQIQEAIHADVAGPEQRKSLQQHLLKIHRQTELLPPMIDLTGEVRRIGDHPVNASGGYSDVYIGEWLDEEKVALQLMRGINHTPKAQKRFIREVAVWRQLQHRNVARLYGIATLGNDIYTVSPWMEHRDAMHYIENFPDADRLKLLREVAAGLEFLHNRGVVHGDLRAAHVLISDAQVACITDFGLSVILEVEVDTQATVHSDNLDNSRWMAPELIQSELIGLGPAKPNGITDVWSYGMLCLEILTGKRPFHNRARSTAVISDLISGILPARPAIEVTHRGLSDELWDLMQRCWRRTPEHRPTMGEVMLRMKALENKQANMQWPYNAHIPRHPRTGDAFFGGSGVSSTSNQGDHPLARQSSSISSFVRLFGPSELPTSPLSSINSLNATSPSPTGSRSFGNLLDASPRNINHYSSAASSPIGKSVTLSITVPPDVPIDKARRFSSGVESSIPRLPLIGEDHDGVFDDFIASMQSGLPGPLNVPIADIEQRLTPGSSEHSGKLVSSTIHSSTSKTTENFSKEASSYIEYSKDGTVTAGTLPALVERLLLSIDHRKDMDFRETFLISYKAFTNAEALFNLLLERFDAVSSPNHTPEQRASIRYSVLQVLITWLQGHHVQIKDIPLLERMRASTQSIQYSSPAPTIVASAGKLTSLIETQVSTHIASPVLPPTPLSSIPRSPTHSPDISPQGLAEALTILESERYSKIMPSDCIGWLVGAQEGNPISSFITEHDKLSYWVTEYILKPDEQSKRFENRKYFLWVAEECRKLHNYSSSCALFAGLASSFITRLRRTSFLDKSGAKVSAGMEKLLSPYKNYQAYRKALNASTESCIPLLHVHLRDITGHHSSHVTIIKRDGHPDMINFKLYHDLHEQISQMLHYHHSPLKSSNSPRSRDARIFLDSQLRSLVVNDALRHRLEQRAAKLDREEHADFASHTQELKASGFL